MLPPWSCCPRTQGNCSRFRPERLSTGVEGSGSLGVGKPVGLGPEGQELPLVAQKHDLEEKDFV